MCSVTLIIIIIYLFIYNAAARLVVWTLVVGHCGLTRMTFGSCSCQERITNSVIGVSRPLVPDYGTTFHLYYGGRYLPLTLLKSL